MPHNRNRCCGVFHLLVLVLCMWCGHAGAQGSGYWHTSGAQILDANNLPVRIAGVNWYGFETTDMVAHGLTSQDYKTVLQTIKTNGYNTVRIPFSNQLVENPVVPSAVQYSNSSGPINTELQGLNALQILDAVIAEAGHIGLRVILDNHRSEAGNGAEGNGLWYTDTYPETAWINDWTTLAQRYLGNDTVIGMDVRNEPHNANSGGACWSCGTPANDWHLAAAKAGNAALAVNPKLLIFVEGTDAIGSDYAFWGGQLAGVAGAPVVLSVPQQLVYSAHDYGPAESAQSWFNNANYAALASYWNTHWGYIATQGIAPVWVGEFGTPNSNSDVTDTAAGSQGLWFSSLIQYFAANPALSWTYWSLNGEDRYGLLPADYSATPQNALKQQALASIQFPLSTPASQQAPTLTLTGSPAAVSAAASATDAGSSAAPTRVTYTATLANTSGAAITTPNVTVTLPAALSILSATATGPGSSCTNSGTPLRCTLGTLGAGSSGTVTLSAVYLASSLDFSAANSVSETLSASSQLVSGAPLTAVAITSVTQPNAQTSNGALLASVSPSSTISYGTPATLQFSLTPAPTTSLPVTAFTVTIDGSPVTVTAAGTNSWQVALGTLKGGPHSGLIQLAATSGYSAASVAVPITVNVLAPTLSLGGTTSSLYGQPMQLAVTVAGGGGLASPTGTVTATIDGGAASKSDLTSGGAVFSFNSIYDVGPHTVGLSYTGDGNYAAATQTTTQQVSPAALAASADAATRIAGTPNPTFTGTLTGVVSGDGITATYTSGADASTVPGIYASGSNAILPMLQDPHTKLKNYSVTLTPGALTITPAATITWANPASIVYGTPLSIVQLNASSNPALSMTYSPPAGSVLNVGMQKLTVSGVSDIITVPVIASVQIVVQQAPTSTIISAPSVITSPYTVTATVTSAQGGTVTGPVHFFDGGALIGSGALDGKGTASFVIPSLSAGPHSFTATFPGDPNNLLSSSDATVVAGVQGSFTLAALPATLAVQVGSSGTTSLSLAPLGGISGAVKLACTGLPSGSSCTFSPATMQFDGSASSLQITLTVTLPTSTASAALRATESRVVLACMPWLLLCSACLTRRRRPGFARLLAILVFVVAGLGLVGCQATSSTGSTGTGGYIGSYNALVTAVSGTITQTTSIQVNVLQ